MWKNENIFRKAIETAINHKARAEEGRKLIKEGRSLSEMKTQPTGLTPEETDERRREYLNFISSMENSKLKNLHKITMLQLEKRYEDPNKGTSELEWQRIVIESELQNRNIIL